MRALVSTFGERDLQKVLLAMKSLPYETLVLIGMGGMKETEAFERIRELEELSGRELLAEELRDDGFMELVNGVSDILGELAGHHSLLLNVSGGDKLLGDAAILAAFRLGIETYHCDGRLTKLPILKGATAMDRFTPSEQKFLMSISGGWMQLDDIAESISPDNRQPVERVMRQLRRLGLLTTEVQKGKIRVALSGEGAEVARAIKASARQ